jgi:ABC transport system ATP-binding/permease protein
VLDEPTNDLDMDTLDLLQEVLVEFAGTLLLVSHDRDFLDRLVTSVIVFAGGGQLQEYAGGYSDMLRQRAAAPAPKPRPMASSRPAKAATRPMRARSRTDRDLDRLLGRIDELTGQVERLEKELADPDLFRRDPAAFAARTERLAGARAELETAEQRWLDLAAHQEQVT